MPQSKINFNVSFEVLVIFALFALLAMFIHRRSAFGIDRVSYIAGSMFIVTLPILVLVGGVSQNDPHLLYHVRSNVWVWSSWTAVSGYIFGFLAVFRSIDIDNSARRCFYALVPVLGLTLWFLPSHTATRRSLRLSPTGNALGIGLVFVLVLAPFYMLSTAREGAIEEHGRRDVYAALLAGHLTMQPALDRAVLLRTLSALAPARHFQPVDNDTVLIGLETDGIVLRRIYQRRTAAPMDPAWRDKMDNALCRPGPMLSVLRAGVTLETVYVFTNGQATERHVTTTSACQSV